MTNIIPKKHELRKTFERGFLNPKKAKKKFKRYSRFENKIDQDKKLKVKLVRVKNNFQFQIF